MTDKSHNNFHETALKSSIFKGRADLYFCYLKSEKIAHAIAFLMDSVERGGDGVRDELVRASSSLPMLLVRFAAHEYAEEDVLAGLFEALSWMRLAASHGLVVEDNAQLVIREYESLVGKISMDKQVSPFLSLEDFAVPPLPAAHALPPSARRPALAPEKDSQGHHHAHHQNKGHASVHGAEPANRASDRATAILHVVVEKKRVSIKDISKIVRACSEKTIQRELNTLIKRGLVRKEGERRWSVYVPA